MISKSKIRKTLSQRVLPVIDKKRRNSFHSDSLPRSVTASFKVRPRMKRQNSLLSVHKRKVRKMKRNFKVLSPSSPCTPRTPRSARTKKKKLKKKNIVESSFRKKISKEKKPVSISPVGAKSFMDHSAYGLLLPNMNPSKKSLKKFHPMARKIVKNNKRRLSRRVSLSKLKLDCCEFNSVYTSFLHPLRLAFPQLGMNMKVEVSTPSQMILSALFKKLELSYETKCSPLNVKLDELVGELDLGALIHDYRVCFQVKDGDCSRGVEWDELNMREREDLTEEFSANSLKSLIMENVRKGKGKVKKDVRNVNYLLAELRRVTVQEKLKKFGSAVQILEKLLAKAKEDNAKEILPLLYNWLACSYMFMLMSPDTLDAHLKACFVKAMHYNKLHLSIAQTKLEKASALTNLGMSCFLAGQMQKAVSLYEKALVLSMGGFVKISVVSNLVLALIMTKTHLEFASLVLNQLFVKNCPQKKCQIICTNILLGHLGAMTKKFKSMKNTPAYFACAYELSSKQNKFLRSYTKNCCLRSVLGK